MIFGGSQIDRIKPKYLGGWTQKSKRGKRPKGTMGRRHTGDVIPESRDKIKKLGPDPAIGIPLQELSIWSRFFRPLPPTNHSRNDRFCPIFVGRPGGGWFPFFFVRVEMFASRGFHGRVIWARIRGGQESGALFQKLSGSFPEAIPKRFWDFLEFFWKFSESYPKLVPLSAPPR